MKNEIEAVTYRIDDAAKLLGISLSSAYAAARTKELPTIRIGKRLLVPRGALEKKLAGADLTNV